MIASDYEWWWWSGLVIQWWIVSELLINLKTDDIVTIPKFEVKLGLGPKLTGIFFDGSE